MVKASFTEAVAACGFEELPVQFTHAELVRTLPPLHRDPFDRILVAQAITEGLTIVTREALVAGYAVPSVWAQGGHSASRGGVVQSFEGMNPDPSARRE